MQSTHSPEEVIDFKTHVKNSFEMGKKASRLFFKYTGIVVGNIIDMPTIAPKIIGKKSGGEIRILNIDEHFIIKDDISASDLFKNHGFAAPLKYIGKRFGEHIIGNIIAGPIAAILSVPVYPIRYLYNKYKTEKAGNIIQQPKDKAKKKTNEEFLSTHSKTKKQFEKNPPSVYSRNHSSNNVNSQQKTKAKHQNPTISENWFERIFGCCASAKAATNLDKPTQNNGSKLRI